MKKSKSSTVILLALLALAGPADAGEVLYNGIELPETWPPRRDKLTREPMPVPYLRNPPAVIPIDVGRQLFVDDFLIEKTDLERTFHKVEYCRQNPVLKPEEPWENKSVGWFAAPFSGGLWYDPADGLFKMWYTGGFLASTCYATSRDGVHWTKPKLDIQKGTNIVLEPVTKGRRKVDTTTIWLDHDAKDPAERFKYFATEAGDGWALTYRASADGVRWSKPLGKKHISGDRTTAFYNPFRKMWVLSQRIHGGSVGRSRSYLEAPTPVLLMKAVTQNKGGSAEGKSVLWTNADDMDPRHTDPKYKTNAPQLYNLDAAPYESLMLGLFSVWQGPSNAECGRLKLQKRNDVLLGFSRDGFHWSRPSRERFISCTWDEKNWRFGNVQSVGGGCLVVGDKLYFYFSGRAKPRGKMWDADAATGLAFLRRDGFASMKADDKGGALTTRPLTFKGKHLFVNVDCPGGELKAEVLDKAGKAIEPFTRENCKAVSCDKTLVGVSWKGGKDLSALAGKPVRLRFHLSGGSLYSFWVSPDASGASHGYVAAGGPGFSGPTDTVGRDAPRPRTASDQPEEGFTSIFDGKGLAGWRVEPADRAGDWSVSDGVLVGKSGGEGSDIVWKAGELDDFELKFSYRFRTPGNSGIHIRCEVGAFARHRLKGYHADLGHVGIGPQVLGAWDFHGTPRGSELVKRGRRVVIDESGRKSFTTIHGALAAGDVRKRDWNDVHVVARGHRLYFTINGKTASEVIDNEPPKRIDRGTIGLQLHKGRPMTVEFRNIRVKRLKPTRDKDVETP